MATHETHVAVAHPSVVPRGRDQSENEVERSDGQAGAGERAEWWGELIQ